MVNTDRVKQAFLDLVRINSPSKAERAVVDYLKPKLTALGLEVEEDDAGRKIGGNAGNLVAFLPGNVSGAHSILLSCHMDTVEPTDKLRVVDNGDEIRSDGTTILGADDKVGIAAVLEAVTSVIEDAVPHGDVQLFFDVSEEIGLLGAKALDPTRIKARLGYVLDTERPVAGITVSAPSHESMTIEVRGTAAHAGIAPEKGVSAIVAASSAISKMNLGRIDEETTANVGRIEGGKARNIVPDHVIVRAEARSRSEDKLVAQVEHMHSLFEQEAAAMGASVKINSTREYSTYRWTEQDEVVRLASRACEMIGIEPQLLEGGGGSDANVFNKAGIPSVVIGVGYEGAHSTSEHVLVSDLAKTAEFAAALIRAAADAEM